MKWQSPITFPQFLYFDFLFIIGYSFLHIFCICNVSCCYNWKFSTDSGKDIDFYSKLSISCILFYTILQNFFIQSVSGIILPTVWTFLKCSLNILENILSYCLINYKKYYFENGFRKEKTKYYIINI